ncbi:hypothetical protein Trisim1_005688 [Trichoderma cf. simile WF8]
MAADLLGRPETVPSTEGEGCLWARPQHHPAMPVQGRSVERGKDAILATSMRFSWVPDLPLSLFSVRGRFCCALELQCMSASLAVCTGSCLRMSV